MKVLHSTKYYDVVELDEQIVDPEFTRLTLSYGLLNTKTDILETYGTFLPSVIETADGLSEMLDELLPEEVSNILTLQQ